MTFSRRAWYKVVCSWQVSKCCQVLPHHDFHWGSTKTYTLLHSHLIKFTIHNFKMTVINLSAKLIQKTAAEDI